MWTTRRTSIEHALRCGGDTYLVTNVETPAANEEEKGNKRIWAVDLRNLSLATSRSFWSLKIWMLLQLYGIKGIQENIRKQVNLARLFANHLLLDRDRFELILEPLMSLVCFKLTKPYSARDTNDLLHMINNTGQVYLNGTWIDETFVIRVCMCSEYADETDVDFLWTIIQNNMDKLDVGMKSSK